MPLPDLFSELRRRRVFRVAGVYAAVAFIVWQAADIAFPALRLPEWLVTAVVALTILGFPLALVLAWAFEITPEGVRRTQPEAPDLARPRQPRSTWRWSAAAIALALTLGVGVYAARGGDGRALRTAAAEMERSVVVLPFVDLSQGQDQEYFCDGITEDILGKLSRIEGVRVISRTSSMRYKGTQKSLREISDELSVAHVLEGSIRRVGDRLRITVQLVHARSDRSLWSETYDRQADDIFALQTEIAEQIASALRVRLDPGARERLDMGGTTSLAAYELNLKGRELLRRTTFNAAEQRANVAGAMALFRQALELDPDYALAYAGLAWAFEGHLELPAVARLDSSAAMSREAIRRAPQLPEGYVEVGYTQLMRWQNEEARRNFERALELDPRNLHALHGLGQIEARNGRLAEGLRYRKQTIEVDPTDPNGWFAVATVHLMVGDLDSAEAAEMRAYDLVGEPRMAACLRARYALDRGNHAQVDPLLRQALEGPRPSEAVQRCAGITELLRGNHEAAAGHLAGPAAAAAPDQVPHVPLAYLALQRGERAEADEHLAAAEARARVQQELCGNICQNYAMAEIRALQGRREEALSYLRRAFQSGFQGNYPFHQEPYFRELWDDPRYRQLWAEMRAHRDAERARIERERI